MPRRGATLCAACCLLVASSAALRLQGAGPGDPGAAGAAAERLEEVLAWGSAPDAALLSVPVVAAQEIRLHAESSRRPAHDWPPRGPGSGGEEYRSVSKRIKKLAKSSNQLEGLPSLDSVGGLLAEAVRRGSEDPCRADVLATIGPARVDRIGFGSRMNNFVNELMVAVVGNLSFAVCGDTLGDGFARNVWRAHFSSGEDIPVCTTDLSRCDFDWYWNELQPFWIGYDLSRKLNRADPEYTTGLKSQLTKFVYRLRGPTQAMVHARLPQALRDTGRRYVGVHVRHGDKGVEDKLLATSKYAAAVRRELKECACNISTVFLSSDDPGAAAEMRTLLGARVEVVEQSRLDEDTYSHESTYDGREALLQLLGDVEALRQSDIFIGTASSNIGRLVYFQRPPEKKSISLDVKFTSKPG
mmetsp:Transcript_27340/g.71566  ORF Transcript_27340/g.71566 Transcript_27340/m.71566 type:complete len:414 (+) Transcript_27340:114-1355(+)